MCNIGSFNIFPISRNYFPLEIVILHLIPTTYSGLSINYSIDIFGRQNYQVLFQELGLWNINNNRGHST